MVIASKLLRAGSAEIRIRPRSQPSMEIRVRGSERGVESAWLSLLSGAEAAAVREQNTAPRAGERKLPVPVASAALDLEQYFEGKLRSFTATLDWKEQGTSFDRDVWSVLLTIPHGEVWSYAEVARRIGKPGAARAVGGAVGRNPIPIWIPCHRVVGSGGRLTGFSAGLQLKTILLEVEGISLAKAPRLANWQVLS